MFPVFWSLGNLQSAAAAHDAAGYLDSACDQTTLAQNNSLDTNANASIVSWLISQTLDHLIQKRLKICWLHVTIYH